MAELLPQADGAESAYWLPVNSCPACGSLATRLTELFKQRYSIATGVCACPPGPISIMRCEECTLVFKNWIASPAAINAIVSVNQASLWAGQCDYADEIRLIETIDLAAFQNVLDVGAAGGAFLRAIPGPGRKSALDIHRFDSLQITGEFICAFVDEPCISWSQDPYDLVGLFDVAEHLYDPLIAFANLRTFCRQDGLLILETGDSDAVPDTRKGHWGYLNLLEHHMAWNEKSLAAVAVRCGFEIVRVDRKYHKQSGPESWRSRLRRLAFTAAPTQLEMAYRILGRSLDVPTVPAPDHIRLVLRAV